MREIELDERLSLALSLYPACTVGADIGTDHGMLPCRLLEDGRCQRMILSDVSAKALAHARELVERRGLQKRTVLVEADGLNALTERVDCVSIMGMGGRTIAEILHAGQDKLQSAALVLSAHTDLEDVRGAVQDIGYRLTCERLCRAGNRWYVFFQAVPGQASYTELERIVGPCLLHGDDPLLPGYAAWRHRVWSEKLAGLRTAREPDRPEIARVETILAAYAAMMKEDTSC